jgi:dynactin-4
MASLACKSAGFHCMVSHSTMQYDNVLQVELPQCELALARCDDAAEFDDSVDQQQIFDDDPAVVLFRKANKIGFSINVTPRQDGDVKVCL